MGECCDGKKTAFRRLRWQSYSPRHLLPRLKEGRLVVAQRSIVLTTRPYERPVRRYPWRGFARSIRDECHFGAVRVGSANMSVWV